MTTTVGKFSMGTDGTIEGPARYMAERFPKFRADLEAGRNAVFNYGCANRKGSVESLVLVAAQTDYAAWQGMATLRRS